MKIQPSSFDQPLRFKIRKGLDLPLAGEPEQKVYETRSVTQSAVLGIDFPGLKPEFVVGLGDHVQTGQTLFVDKKKPQIRFTAPGSGRIVELNRGAKRAFLSLVIKLEGQEEAVFETLPEQELTRAAIVDLLLKSGQWVALRQRPFGYVADPEIVPHSIFVTALDSSPLAPDLAVVLQGWEREFAYGLRILLQLTEGRVFVCQAPGVDLPRIENSRLIVAEFSGPHPAGLPGTHVHFLDPVSRQQAVWQINAEEVVAIGHLFNTGRLLTERTIALSGPGLIRPRLVRTRLGAQVTDLMTDELRPGLNRVIAGSVLNGHAAADELRFLGRFQRQITVLAEDQQRRLFGWLTLGRHEHSVKRVVLSRFLSRRRLALTTSTHGSARAIIPVGSYEKVMPLDLLPTFLLRALAMSDLEEAEKLGALELLEEDLALCTYVCPAKIDHGQNLRQVLAAIAKENL